MAYTEHERFAMRQVRLNEDEKHFAALIAEAEAGESLIIFRGNKPVAQIIPFPEPPVDPARREAAIAELRRIMQEGIPMGGVPPTRDEMHDRV